MYVDCVNCQVMNNPALIRQVMENPMVQQIVSNPEIMRQMMLSNPQMRDLMEVGILVGKLHFTVSQKSSPFYFCDYLVKC